MEVSPTTDPRQRRSAPRSSAPSFSSSPVSTLAVPKSVILTLICSFSRMLRCISLHQQVKDPHFSGLRSRWITPLLWMYSTADRI